MNVPVTCPVCQQDGTATLYFQKDDPECGYRGGWELDQWDLPCPCYDSRLVNSSGFEQAMVEQAAQNAQDADEAARDAYWDAKIAEARGK